MNGDMRWVVSNLDLLKRSRNLEVKGTLFLDFDEVGRFSIMLTMPEDSAPCIMMEDFSFETAATIWPHVADPGMCNTAAPRAYCIRFFRFPVVERNQCVKVPVHSSFRGVDHQQIIAQLGGSTINALSTSRCVSLGMTCG